MAKKQKTISDWQKEFKALFNAMEADLGTRVSEVRISTRESYPDDDNQFTAVLPRKKVRQTVCNIYIGDDSIIL